LRRRLDARPSFGDALPNAARVRRDRVSNLEGRFGRSKLHGERGGRRSSRRNIRRRARPDRKPTPRSALPAASHVDDSLDRAEDDPPPPHRGRQEQKMAEDQKPDAPETPKNVPPTQTPPPAPAPKPAAAKPAAPAPAAPAKPVDPAALKPHAPKPQGKSSLGPTAPSGVDGGLLQRRRDFTWFALSAMGLAALGVFMRFFFPRTLFEPKTRFMIGYPSDYGFGVDIKYQQSQRIWVCRGPQGLYVISAVCTHLGCTPDWLSGENQFKCPCHGSVYDAEGNNFAGPAPKPMLRCHVELAADGRIVVDKLKQYDAVDFDKPGAYLAV
jgi:cytochrome b6-f complex iron-sulfur subunit